MGGNYLELYTIPFGEQFLIYRPLRKLAFIGNKAMTRYIKEQPCSQAAANDEIMAFLGAIGFWESDPLLPEPFLSIKKPTPFMGVLLMTSACNLRCLYCYARGGEDPSLQMTYPLAKAVIDKVHENACLKKQECFSLCFHGGGEPTLNWDVLKGAVEYAHSKDLPCHISMSSNGVWNDDQREFIIKNFREVSISFDGIPDVQNSQRPFADGSPSFDAVMKTIHALDEAGLPYGIRLTATPGSFLSLPESIQMLCRETECKVFQVEPSYVFERGVYADPTIEQADAFAGAFIEGFITAAQAGRTLFYSGARPWTLSGCFCRALEDSLVVTPEGDIVTCFETHDRRHSLVSQFTIGQASTSGMVVDMEKLRAFAEKQRSHRESCRGCFCYWHCAGDCATRWMSSPDQNRIRCYVNRTITREMLAWYISSRGGVWCGS